MQEKRTYKYYDLIMAAFVAVLLCSNLIGVQKVSSVNLPFYGEYIYGAGVLFFPISYLFGDILTEVYGYARSRKVIWAGFGALIFASVMALVVTNLPLPVNVSPESMQGNLEKQKAIEDGKPAEIAEKIAQGRVAKELLSEIVLLEQQWYADLSRKVGDVVGGLQVKRFVRIEAGKPLVDSKLD